MLSEKKAGFNELFYSVIDIYAKLRQDILTLGQLIFTGKACKYSELQNT